MHFTMGFTILIRNETTSCYFWVLMLLSTSGVLPLALQNSTDNSTGIQFPSEIDDLVQCSPASICVTYTECTVKQNSTEFPPDNHRSICGWNGVEPLICCSSISEALQLDKSQTTTEEPKEEPECGKTVKFETTTPAGGLVINAVVAGSIADVGSWPWMAAIILKNTTNPISPFCGGSLITANFVLTAAHCFIDIIPACELEVILGDLVLGDDSDRITPVKIDIGSVRTHENYNFPSVYNDIAIVKLKRCVEFTPNILPVCIPQLDFKEINLDDQIATVTGWGHTNFGGLPSNALQQADLSIVSNSKCETTYSKLLGTNESLKLGITQSLLCAGNELDNKDACQGDSGGPLLYNHKGSWILVGVISSGFECGRRIPGIYTRVSEYTDWIKAHT